MQYVTIAWQNEFKNIGYVRKVITISENQNEEGNNSRYGIVEDSVYYDKESSKDMKCTEGEAFIISTFKRDNNMAQVNIYSLVICDSSVPKGFRIIDSVERNCLDISYPYPENILVGQLLDMGIVEVVESKSSILSPKQGFQIQKKSEEKKYFVVLKECGIGCDYMIGCGMTTTTITAKDETDLFNKIKEEYSAYSFEDIKYVELERVKTLDTWLLKK